jgi:hypothetical protein
MMIEIADDDGMIALVDAKCYRTFVDEDWSLEQLKSHFINEMNNDSLIVWQTNNFGGGYWRIGLTEMKDQNKSSHSEFKKTLRVTNGRIYFSNYTDLTMAAQFSDYSIPSIENSKKYIELDNGLYEFTICRLFDPATIVNSDKIDFEIFYQKIQEHSKISISTIFWWTS